MDTLPLIIADHPLTIIGHPEAELLRSVAGFPVFVSDCQPANCWAIRFGLNISVPSQSRLLTSFPFDNGEVQCYLYGYKDTLMLKMIPNQGEPLIMKYLIGAHEVHATHTNNLDMLRFGCWFAFSMLIGQINAAPIHSSTIVYQDKSVLFLGESGTGKSTHTRLWLENIPGTRLLNDDSPILTVNQGHPVVYGSPWSGKTHCYHKEHYPLAGVVRLSQAPLNTIRHLSIIEGFAALQPSLPPALALVDFYADRWVNIVSEVLRHVPVFHLSCLPNEEAALLSCSAIYAN